MLFRSATVSLDKTKPTITGSRTPAANDFGWNNTYSSIHPVLQGDNPDNSFSEVPYEKGFQMLQYIEDSILGYTLMEDFLTYYVYNNEFTSID